MGGVRIDWHIRQLRDDAESHSDKVYENNAKTTTTRTTTAADTFTNEGKK